MEQKKKGANVITCIHVKRIARSGFHVYMFEGELNPMSLRSDADKIIEESLRAVLPDQAVKRALKNYAVGEGKTILIAAGKAAWQMANAARNVLGDTCTGIVITKYEHVREEIPGMECYEAGHPVPDENGAAATRKAMELVTGLTKKDRVVFLLSGGGSALFEKPLVPLEELQDITGQLLACGADIVEINTIRKRLSEVKGGRFAKLCAPARVYSIILSDILGDPIDMIASGPTYPDSSTCEEAQKIAEKYHLKLSDKAKELLNKETPKTLENSEVTVTGSVRELCVAAGKAAEKLGYEPVFLTDQLSCEAREAGSFLASILKSHQRDGRRLAFLAGGETVVHLTGKGKGGRNQELAFAAAAEIDGMENAAVFSFGSDGTDGPTDAAGGYVDGASMQRLRELGIDANAVLQENDTYPALKQIEGLIMTGPTGTNVNDVAVALLG